MHHFDGLFIHYCLLALLQNLKDPYLQYSSVIDYQVSNWRLVGKAVVKYKKMYTVKTI